jgi:hypothetical protein
LYDRTQNKGPAGGLTVAVARRRQYSHFTIIPLIHSPCVVESGSAIHN